MEILRCSKCGSGQVYFRRKDNSSVCKTCGQVQVLVLYESANLSGDTNSPENNLIKSNGRLK